MFPSDPDNDQTSHYAGCDFRLSLSAVSHDAVDNPVQVEIVNTDDVENTADVYIVGGSYDNHSIRLNRNDNGAISIDVSPISGWYEDSGTTPVQPEEPEDPEETETEVQND